jgi:hypothetical protein
MFLLLSGAPDAIGRQASAAKPIGRQASAAKPIGAESTALLGSSRPQLVASTRGRCFGEVCQSPTHYCDRMIRGCASCANDCHRSRLVDAHTRAYCADRCPAWVINSDNALWVECKRLPAKRRMCASARRSGPQGPQRQSRSVIDAVAGDDASCYGDVCSRPTRFCDRMIRGCAACANECHRARLGDDHVRAYCEDHCPELVIAYDRAVSAECEQLPAKRAMCAEARRRGYQTLA